MDARDHVDAASNDLLRFTLGSVFHGRAERTHLVRHGLVAFHGPIESIRSLTAAYAAVLAEALVELVRSRLSADSVPRIASASNVQLAQWVRVHG